MEGQFSLEIRSTPERVYDMVADITRMGEWSPECYRCEWIGDHSQAGVGARFMGYNRSGLFRWSNVSEIVVADRGRELAWIMGGPEKSYSSWRYAFEAVPSGTLVTESFRSLRHTLLGRLGALPLGGERKREQLLRAGLAATLERLKVAAESLM
jgi:hypothetical protein